jgi:hypothetical protein
MQYILIEEIRLENKCALSNNATAPIFLANALASTSFHTDIARMHPVFSAHGCWTTSKADKLAANFFGLPFGHGYARSFQTCA